MTDGLYFDAQATALTPGTVCPEAKLELKAGAIDLTTFAQWIECQPTATIASIVDLIGNDLYRRHWPTYAADVKSLARNMRTTLQYNEEHAT